MDKECNCKRKKIRNEQDYKKLVNRLNRIEGQVRGLINMLKDDAYCIDILTQSSAVSAAINAFNKELLSEHLHSCVIDDIKNGNYKSMDEVADIIRKFMK